MKSCFSRKVVGRIVAGLLAACVSWISVAEFANAEETNCDEVIENVVDNELDTESDSEVVVEQLEDETSDLELVSYTEGGIVYSLINGDQYRAVSYSGSSNTINIPEEVDDKKVVSIGEGFVKNNTNIVYVNIPLYVYEISKEAFAGCTNLTTVNFATKTVRESGFFTSSYQVNSLLRIEDGAFRGDVKLSQISLPVEGLEKIGAEAFKGCSSMTSVTFPKTLTTIGKDAFDGCENLATVTSYGGLTEWLSLTYGGTTKGTHPNAYASHVYLYELTEQNYSYNDYSRVEITSLSASDLSRGYEIKEYEFAGFAGLTTVDLSAMSTIKEGAFMNCTALTTVSLENNLSVLGAYAFAGDIKLRTIYLGTGLGAINEKTFYGCSSLDNITVEKYINTIATDAFDNCSNLKNIKVYQKTAADEYFSAGDSYRVRYLDTTSSTDSKISGALVGYSAVYDGRVGMRFYISKSSPSTSDYVTFIVPTESGSDEQVLYYKDATYDSSRSAYVFTIYFNPKFANEEIGFVLSGTTTSYWISFQYYAELVIKMNNVYCLNSNAESVIRALYTYCDATQKYLNYNAGTLKSAYCNINTNVCSSSEYAPSITDEDYLGMSLVLEDTLTVKLYYKGIRNDLGLTITAYSYLGNPNLKNYYKVYQVSDLYTVIELYGLTFGINPAWNEIPSISNTYTITKNGNETSDYFLGVSYLYLAASCGDEKLKYLADAIYTLEIFAYNYDDDVQVK